MARSLSSKGRSDRLVIAAIDLGTIYSGYAYTFKHELGGSDQHKICAKSCQITGSQTVRPD